MGKPLILAASLLAAACGRPGPTLVIPAPDAGPDAGPQTFHDAGTDAGTHDGGFEPTPSLHAALKLQLTFARPPFILERPSSIDAVLTLAESGRDVTGTLALTGTPGTPAAAVRGTLDGATVTLEPGAARFAPSGSLAWTMLTVALVEGGSGSAAGMWTSNQGDVIDQSDYTATLTAAKDTAGSKVTAGPLIPDPYRSLLLPVDGVLLRLGEPVSETSARANLRLLAAAQPRSATMTTRAAVAGRATSFELRPDAWLPFDTELSIDPGALTDPAGNAIVADAVRPRTVADPGPMLTNPDFELGMTGWAVVGRQAIVQAELHGVLPASGAAMLVIRQETAVGAYFDVPAGATRLSFSAALFSELGMFDRRRTATLTLHVAGREPQLVFDAKDQETKNGPCSNCAEFTKKVPPERYEVDVTALRGQQVFLVAEVRSSGFIGLTQYALVLDDVRLE